MVNHPQRMQRLLAWLSFMPPLERVARSLVLDYLASINPNQSIIWHLNKNDSLICLAHYGDQESLVGRTFPGTVWRSWSETSSFGSLITTKNPITWSKENTQVSIKLYAQNMLIGFLVLRFAVPVKRTQDMNSEIAEFSLSLSLYLALRFHESLGLDDEVPTSHTALLTGRVNRKIELTTRQVSVLSGIAAKKTNHEIAKELGYSVSTIRHETMRIFETFGVSDRVAAAVEGKRLGLL